MRLEGGWVAALCALFVCGGCGGGDDDGSDGDGGGDGGGVEGVAHVVQGATPPPAFAIATGVATDGTWYVSPDRIRVTLTRVNFAGATTETGTGADLADCVVTYDRSAATLDPLLDCPFSIDPGTYVGMTLFVNGTAEVFISDDVNGIYTDPGSASGLSSTEPDGGADFVDVTTALGGGAEQFFSAPLVVAEGDAVSLAVVIDAIQSATITVSNGGADLEFGDYFPAFVFPTIGSPGAPQYYTSAGTADSYNDSLVLANIMRVYYEPDGAPAYAVFQQRAGDLSQCTDPAYGIGAYPADPDEVTPYNDGSRAGGWLGLDEGGTLCWAYAADKAYETYANYLTMDPVDSIGDDAVIHCEQTDTPTPPSSGSTYASGCPAIVEEHSSATLSLVAD